MSVDAVSQYLSQIGRKGGKARLKTMTPEQRRTVALKASKAAAVARSKRAKRKKERST